MYTITYLLIADQRTIAVTATMRESVRQLLASLSSLGWWLPAVTRMAGVLVPRSSLTVVRV